MRRTATKWALLSVAVVLLIGVMMLAAACGEDEETTTTASAGSTTTAAPVTTVTTAPPETTTTEAAGPVPGGRLQHIVAAGPQNVGFWPKMGPTDEGPIWPSIERICDYKDRKMLPFLAKTFVEDPAALTMTVALNEGIMFHDGTELTAEVAVWNYQIGIDGHKLQFADAIDNIEITGKYSYVIHLKRWDNQLIHSFGWVPMFSKAAFEASGATPEEREAWALDHCVGTGPFIMTEYVRDQSITWDKNPNYWQKGLPYLDGIDMKMIPDPTTAAQVMQAGQGDIWQQADAQSQDQMKKAGFTVQSGWAGLIYHLMPNTMDPASPLSKLEVRKAVEYAINKEELAGALGYGIDKPIYAVSPPGEWGSDAVPESDYYKYDPAKAKELLVAAGYADGCPIDLLAITQAGGGNAYGEAIKGYLDAAGFITKLDIADPGRFYGSVFGTGWKDLAMMFSGTDPNHLISCNRWWSPTPMTNLVSFKRPAEFTQLFADANASTDEAVQQAKTGEIVKLMHDQEVMIPMFIEPNGLVVTDYVHTLYPTRDGFIWTDWPTVWMDPH